MENTEIKPTKLNMDEVLSPHKFERDKSGRLVPKAVEPYRLFVGRNPKTQDRHEVYFLLPTATWPQGAYAYGDGTLLSDEEVRQYGWIPCSEMKSESDFPTKLSFPKS